MRMVARKSVFGSRRVRKLLLISAAAGLGSSAALVQRASGADKTWTGTVDGSWDLITTNWRDGAPAIPAGLDTTYAVGDAVFFTDNFSGTNTTIGPVAASTNALSSVREKEISKNCIERLQG